MALKERVEEVLMDLGMEPIKVTVARDHVENGIPSWKVEAQYLHLNERIYRSEWSIAKANGMSEDEMTRVIASYIRAENFNEVGAAV